MTRARLRPAGVAAVIFAIALAGCGGYNGNEPTATVAPDTTAVIDTPATQSLTTGAGSLATDGICQITIPDSWVDDGTGRGQTEHGDRWALFGGSLSSDEDWTAARDLLKAQVANQEGVEISESDDEVAVTRPNGHGVVVRKRFDRTYCELAISSTQDRDEEITTIWQNVAETLGPVEAD
jgi:hypothetical protein